MAFLKFTNDAGEDQIVEIGPKQPVVVIGRKKECQLFTRNNTVSRQHAQVIWRDGKFILVDIGSANGTYHRRKRIPKDVEVPLESGDEFFCGSLQIKFIKDSDEEPPTVIEPHSRPTIEAETTGYDEEPPPPPSPSSYASSGQRPTVGYDGLAEEVMVGIRTEAQYDDEMVSFASAEPSQDVVSGTKSEVVQFTPEPPDARKILEDEKRREEEEAKQHQRILELERQLKERDETIDKLGLQVEELQRLVAQLQTETTDESAVRIADLERVLIATQKEQESLEEALAAAKEEVARAIAEKERIASDATEIAEMLERVTRERDALIQENERWEALKRQFEEERSSLQTEVESLRRQITTLTEQIESSRVAVGRAEELAAALKAATDELAELKSANRSYLKKISRLLEENEKLRAGSLSDDSSRKEALREEVEKLRAEAEAAKTEAERLAARVKELESRPVGSTIAREALERVNDLVSQAGMSILVITRLLPELRLQEGQEELGEQLRSAIDELAESVHAFKTEILKARKAV